VPPYRETRAYIAKIQALHAGYRRALKLDAHDVVLEDVRPFVATRAAP
jgi:hypothetical protein